MNKKISMWGLSLILAFMLSICGRINVNALTITTHSNKTIGDGFYLVTNKGSFRIYDSISTDAYPRFYGYKIVDVYYNSSKDAIKYSFTTNFREFLNSSHCPEKYKSLTIDEFMNLDKGTATRNNTTDSAKGAVHGGFETANEFADLMTHYAKYTVSYVTSDATLSDFYAASENSRLPFTESTNVEVGTYLILPHSSSQSLFSVMVDSVQLSKNNNEWEITGGEIISKNIATNVTYELKRTKSNTYNTTDFSVNSGDELQGKVTIFLPNTYFVNSLVTPKMKVGISAPASLNIDNFSLNNDLTINNNRKIIYNGIEIGSIDSELDYAGNINLVFNDISSLLGKTIEITYNSKPIESAPKGVSKLCYVYINSPYNDNISSNGDMAYRGEIKVSSYVLRVTGTVGAQFKVIDSTGTNRGTITIGSDGIGELFGLMEGTYTLTQTKAPPGYALISDSHNAIVGLGGEEVAGKIGYYNTTIKNTVPALLPFTGSKGTILFTVVGALFIISSITFLIIYKKKKQNIKNATAI